MLFVCVQTMAQKKVHIDLDIVGTDTVYLMVFQMNFERVGDSLKFKNDTFIRQRTFKKTAPNQYRFSFDAYHSYFVKIYNPMTDVMKHMYLYLGETDVPFKPYADFSLNKHLIIYFDGTSQQYKYILEDV